MIARSKSLLLAAAGAVALAAAAAALPAPAETVVFRFPALRADVATCVWFDDNINDRSLGAIIRQTDLLYNRLALPPDATVTNVSTATTQRGAQEAQFDLGRTLLCADSEAIHPPTPIPSLAPPVAP